MNIFDIIRTRYSHKEAFTSQPVPLADLEKIAEAGISAPSGVNRQTVRLIILPDRAALDPVAELADTIGLTTAPAAIAVLTDKTLSPPDRMNFEKEDYSAAMQNILLAATALGYSSLWLDSPYFDPAREAATRAVLGAADTYRLWACVPIGLPEGTGSRREKLPYAERVFVGSLKKI